MGTDSLRGECMNGDGHDASSGIRDGRDPADRSRLFGRARLSLVLALAALTVSLVVVASASAFDAKGSVEQVDVTGLAADAQMSLVNAHGKVLSTQNADPLGGLLFRNVKPGSGYQRSPGGLHRRIRSDHRPHMTRPAPWDPEHLQPGNPGQRLHLPDDPRRHPAGDRRAPADQPRR